MVELMGGMFVRIVDGVVMSERRVDYNLNKGEMTCDWTMDVYSWSRS